MYFKEFIVRPEIVDVNSDEPVFFFFFQFKTSKYSGSCNTKSKLCVPDVVKNFNVRTFNLMSRTNETRHIKWYEMCKCKCNKMQVFVIINKGGIKINANVNVKS